MNKIRNLSSIISFFLFLLYFVSCKKSITTNKLKNLDICMKEDIGLKNKQENTIDFRKKSKIRKKRDCLNSKIFLGTENYKEIATKGYYSDKSLLIQQIYSSPLKILLLSMPRRWGKSSNLDMLRRFLTNIDDNNEVIDKSNRESTDNYKLFAGGYFETKEGIKLNKKYIAKSKLAEENFEWLSILGTFPVIYVDFKNCKENDIQSVRDAIKESLRLAFIQHKYLLNSLSQEDQDIFGKFISKMKPLNDNQIKNSLHWLSEWLHKYHGKKVWILIDEYDAALNHAYTTIDNASDIKLIKNLFVSLYSRVLKNNNHIDKAVLTGILELALSDGESGLNNISAYSINSFDYAQYYGLQEKEIKQLCKDNNIQQVKEWYNGYLLKEDDKQSYSYYNVWSMANYLTEKKIKSYWQSSDSFNFLAPFFQHKGFLPTLDQLIHLDKEIRFNLQTKFDIRDFKILKEIRNNLNRVKIKPDGLDLFFSYLFFTGYLTKSERDGYYRCPNKEIQVALSRKILRGYEEIYKFDVGLIRDISNVLIELLDINDINDIRGIINTLKEKYQELLNKIDFINKKSDSIGLRLNEDCLHTLMNMAVFLTLDSNQGTEIYTNKIINDQQTENKGRADIVLMNENIGIIIEVKHNGSAKDALVQAQEYTSLINKCRHKIFVGLNVDNSKKAIFEVKIA